jgi:hypothetical protein
MQGDFERFRYMCFLSRETDREQGKDSGNRTSQHLNLTVPLILAEQAGAGVNRFSPSSARFYCCLCPCSYLEKPMFFVEKLDG